MSRGFLFDLSDEMENSANIHRQVILRVERITQRNLICYVANPAHPGGAMQDHDPDLLENILRSVGLARYQKKIDLLVNSPGGFPYAAGKMVEVCRTFSSEFRTIVLGRAMSAATLLCLGSQELIMGDTASLGPIDPQILRGSPQGQRLVPAHVVIGSFKDMLENAQQAIMRGQPPDPFLHVLNTLDVTAVHESMRALESTKTIAKDLLRRGLLRNDLVKIDTVVDALMAEGEKELHGKHLYPRILQEQIGLPVTVLPMGSKLDRSLRELFVRLETYTSRKGIAKYLMTRQGGLDINVEVRQ